MFVPEKIPASKERNIFCELVEPAPTERIAELPLDEMFLGTPGLFVPQNGWKDSFKRQAHPEVSSIARAWRGAPSGRFSFHGLFRSSQSGPFDGHSLFASRLASQLTAPRGH